MKSFMFAFVVFFGVSFALAGDCGCMPLPPVCGCYTIYNSCNSEGSCSGGSCSAPETGVRIPSPPSPIQQPPKEIQPRPSLPSMSITLAIRVPTIHTPVVINGMVTRSVGHDRVYISNNLYPNARYKFTVQVGNDVRQVVMAAGESYSLDFSRAVDLPVSSSQVLIAKTP